MTKENNAQLASDHGAKSRSPVMPEGKGRTRANALRRLAGPHPAADRRAHYAPPGNRQLPFRAIELRTNRRQINASR